MRKNAKYQETHRKLASELGKESVPLTQPRQKPVAAQPAARRPSPSRGEAKPLRRRQFIRFYELPDNYVTIEQSRRADFHTAKTDPQPEQSPATESKEPYWID